MENLTLNYIIGTFLITSIVWMLYLHFLKSKFEQLKNTHQNLNLNIDNELIVRGSQNLDQLKQEITQLKSEMSEVKQEKYIEGYKAAKNEFFLNITPYYEEIKLGNDGFIVNDFYHKVNVGYKYQLFINNLPILEPTVRWEKIIEEKKKEVDHNKIKSALEIIENNLIPIVAQSNGILKYIPISKKK